MIDLVDLLVCPRCGPPHGLVLFSRVVSERKLLEGELGCPNCRSRYPVEGGVADLRPPFEGKADAPAKGRLPKEARPLLDTLPGILDLPPGDGPARVVVALDGAFLPAAKTLSSQAPGAEAVFLDAAGSPAQGPPVTVMKTRGRLPFRDGSLQGAVFLGSSPQTLEPGEVARALAPGARVAVLAPGETPLFPIDAAALSPVFSQPLILVAQRAREAELATLARRPA